MLTAPIRVALAQATMTPLFAASGYALAGRSGALALFYGGLVALVASLLMVWRERTAMRHPEWDGRKLFGVFVLSGIERFVAVILMLAVGLGGLRLSPLQVVLGFALAQLAWLAVALSYRNKQH
jgi:ATP synthase protein I